MSRLGVDGHPVICFEDQVGLGPFHPGFRLTRHLSRKFNLAASLGSQTCQQLGIQPDLWRLCTEGESEGSRTGFRVRVRVLYIFFLPTFWINGLDLIGGLAGHAGTESVEGSDSVGVPLAFCQTRHLELQIRHQVTAGLPLVGSSLAAVYVVTTDAGAAVVLWWLPGQEDAAG